MTKHAYSPDTGELIRTDSPAEWMGLTDVAPPSFDPATAGCFWRGDHWEIVPGVSPAIAQSADIRADRDGRISAVQWRIQRYEQQAAAGLPTNDTADQYKALLAYVQALRDVPAQSGFPASVDWPVVPA
jgi:hypothetical protein